MPPNAPRQPPNAQLFARLSHLYQAANELAPASGSLARFYLTTLRSVAKKNVLRLDPAVKRTICKRCDSLLVPGVSCVHRIENKSSGGRKPWADVLVIECNACGTVKRFPVGMDELKMKRGKPFKLWTETADDGNADKPAAAQKGKKGKVPQVFKLAGVPAVIADSSSGMRLRFYHARIIEHLSIWS